MFDEQAIFLLHRGGDAEQPFLESIVAVMAERAKKDANLWKLEDGI